MTEPVKAVVPVEFLERVSKVLRECADDLQAYADAEYPIESRKQYPSYERRYKNQQEVIREANACFDSLFQMGFWGQN